MTEKGRLKLITVLSELFGKEFLDRTPVKCYKCTKRINTLTKQNGGMTQV